MPNFSSSDLDRAYIDRKVFSFLVGIDRFTEAQTKERLNEAGSIGAVGTEGCMTSSQHAVK